MTVSNLEIGLYIFVLSAFLGFEVIRRVPQLLHTLITDRMLRMFKRRDERKQ